MQHVKLHNGVLIPQVGLGTWQITDREQMRSLLAEAYAIGYRLVDTAAAYSNEMAIGKAIADLPRQDLFLSDKVWNTCRGYDKVIDACKRSLKKMKTDYFDLYLIHWPASPKLYSNWTELNADTWRGMEALYQEGLVRAIGVCNFKPHHLAQLEQTARVLPMVNQIECHPGYPQTETLAYCKERKIVVQASSPLGNGQILAQPLLQEIGQRYGKTSAQVCLRWAIQKELVVIPKTTSVTRLRENFDCHDFCLSEAELRQIDGIDYCGGLGIDPDEVTEYG